MEVSGQLHVPTALPPGEKTPVPTHWIGDFGEPQIWPGQCAVEKDLDLCREFNAGLRARSPSLCRALMGYEVDDFRPR
jgi:hypothetical protein